MLAVMVTRSIATLGLFCGSSEGYRTVYREAALDLSHVLIERGVSLVYGGGGIGLMGVVARAVSKRIPSLTGVIPRMLHERIPAHAGVEDALIVVEDMHQRKAKMYDLSDAFIALPGGPGTLEEIMETFVWLHLGYHRKPVGLLNTAGFFDDLLRFLSHSVEEGFLKRQFLDCLCIDDDPGVLLDKLASVDLHLPSKID